jgi:large subunit ribosomal protein L19
MKPIAALEAELIQKEDPEFRPGDTVRAYVRFREGNKERVQPFEGVVIRINRNLARSTVTIRKVSYGVGVERILPLHSPNLDKLDVITHARVRRSRLYYLRERRGKAARMKAERATGAQNQNQG